MKKRLCFINLTMIIQIFLGITFILFLLKKSVGRRFWRNDCKEFYFVMQRAHTGSGTSWSSSLSPFSTFLVRFFGLLKINLNRRKTSRLSNFDNKLLYHSACIKLKLKVWRLTALLQTKYKWIYLRFLYTSLPFSTSHV